MNPATGSIWKIGAGLCNQILGTSSEFVIKIGRIGAGLGNEILTTAQ